MATTNTIPPTERKLVTPHSPAAGVSVPADRIFEEHHNQYMESVDAQKVANGLMERYHRFDHLVTVPIHYLWKQKGGMTKGRENWGGVTPANDLHRLGTECMFFVWVAADNARHAKMNHFQFEALMYSLLCRIEEKLDNEGEPTGEMGIVGPEFTGFFDEIRNYGAWNEGLTTMRDISLQIPLFSDHGDSGAMPPNRDEELGDLLDKAADVINDSVEGVTATVRRGPGRPRKEQLAEQTPIDTPV